MDRCPVCRATLGGADVCRRCRTELGSVLRAETLAGRLEGLAIRCLATGEVERAARLLRRARLLHATPTIRALCRTSGHAP